MINIFGGVFILGFEVDNTFRVIEASLNGSLARQKVIAHNVSNINTPGFKRFLVDFEEQLANPQRKPAQLPLKVTRARHISIPVNEDFAVTRDLSPGLRADGNNVNLEQEMSLMVKNNVYFNAALNQINKKIAVRKYVLSDGRG